MRQWIVLTLSCSLVLCHGAPAHARDLQGRLGLGYNSQFANAGSGFAPFATPGISLKYAVTRDIALNLIGGLTTSTRLNAIVGGKVYKTLFFETNLNFYTMIGFGLVSGGGNGGIDAFGGFGAEFFIPGIESLGIQFETGAGIDNLSGSFVFKTIGVSILNAGIHFYF